MPPTASQIVWKRQRDDDGATRTVSADGRFVIEKLMRRPNKGIGNAQGLTHDGYVLTDTITGVSRRDDRASDAKETAERVLYRDREWLRAGIVGWSLPADLARQWPIGLCSVRLVLADGTRREGPLMPAAQVDSPAERATKIRAAMTCWCAYHGIDPLPETAT